MYVRGGARALRGTPTRRGPSLSRPRGQQLALPEPRAVLPSRAGPYALDRRLAAHPAQVRCGAVVGEAEVDLGVAVAPYGLRPCPAVGALELAEVLQRLAMMLGQAALL